MIAQKKAAQFAFILALSAALSAAGCRHLGGGTVIASPPIVGRLQHGDGTPIAHARVAVSTTTQDSTCANPAATTTVDSAGRFSLPATTARVSSLLIHRASFGYRFHVCVGRADDLHPIQTAYIGNDPGPPTLVLRCIVEREARDITKDTCTVQWSNRGSAPGKPPRETADDDP